MSGTDVIELRRAPGTCCPEPSCDYRTGGVCEMCGHRCDECGRNAPPHPLTCIHAQEDSLNDLVLCMLTEDTCIIAHRWCEDCPDYAVKPSEEA